MQLNLNIIRNLLDNSLKEDFGIRGDITSDATITPNSIINFRINSRKKSILSGVEIAKYYLKQYTDVNYSVHKQDGEKVSSGEDIISGRGDARDILLVERVLLNYLQHLSGISTLTHQYVSKTNGTKAKILDTRKTTPMLRTLEKYAVFCGGGHNHRLALDSAIMIKDNHIAICGDIGVAIRRAKENNPHYAKIEVECDTLEQVKIAASSDVDIILLDNMPLEQLKEAINIINGRALIEASGNVSLETVEKIAQTGVDYISIGKITHSAPIADIGLDIYF